MADKLLTRINANGYSEFWDPREGCWVLTHRRVMEKALGRKLKPGEHVHHINHNRQDNRRENLVVLPDNIHRRIHGEAPDACFRCGRSGHFAENCYAKSDFEGNPLD